MNVGAKNLSPKLIQNYPSPQPSPQRGEGVTVRSYKNLSSIVETGHALSLQNLHQIPLLRGAVFGGVDFLNTPSPLCGEGWGEGAFLKTKKGRHNCLPHIDHSVVTFL
jgi:hypothetical protein